jgi:branched-chain amino acid transport system substrate-binding protein
MELAVDQVNSSHYLGNARLLVKYKDTDTSTQEAVNVTREMIGNVAAIAGFTFGNQAAPAAAIAQASRTPMIITLGSDYGITAKAGSYVTTTDGTPLLFSQKIVTALKARGVTKTAFVYDSDEGAAAALDAALKAQFPKAGISWVDVPYTSSDSNFEAGISKALAAHVNAIGCDLVGATSITCLSEARAAGFKGVMWGADNFAGGPAEAAGHLANGLLFMTTFSYALPYSAAKTYIAQYKAKFGQAPGGFDVDGYDAIWLIARAIKAEGGTSSAAIQAGITKVEQSGFSSPEGPLTWCTSVTSQCPAEAARMVISPGAIIEMKNGKEVDVG